MFQVQNLCFLLVRCRVISPFFFRSCVAKCGADQRNSWREWRECEAVSLSRLAFSAQESFLKGLESYESPVIQEWWPDSRRGHRCGRARTAPVTTAASCDIRAI